MANITLQTAVRSLTRSVLLNTGRKIHDDHDDDNKPYLLESEILSELAKEQAELEFKEIKRLERDHSYAESSASSSMDHQNSIHSIANKIGLTDHTDPLHSILHHAKSSPQIRSVESHEDLQYEKSVSTARFEGVEEEAADQTEAEDDPFQSRNDSQDFDHYDAVTADIPTMEHGVVLFR